ncbi:hypothetical protein N7516_009464 [Penicillium verrucosum]|uniref:uncharacterized protein n=1 Tax=Penicillium verrucosum TaxID=60171 RepID=UPI00254571DB|nr:uncharacterized protein N7516_009464 [Penicillium verrucosum]KAJ5927691.1 hypothetical protein N7516_009464 [Penicillium verrucosum]
MSNPPGNVRIGIINRGNRRQRAEIIDRELMFVYGFTTARHTEDAATLTGIACGLSEHGMHYMPWIFETGAILSADGKSGYGVATDH